MPDIEYFFAAHSAFSYLGAARFYDIAKSAGRGINFRPVDLGKVVAAAHETGFAGRSTAHRNYYFRREIERWGAFRGVPLKGGIPANHGHDITVANCAIIAAGLLGLNAGALALALHEAHWNHHADLSDKVKLAEIMASANLPAEAILGLASKDTTQGIYAKNTKDALALPIFGAPTYVLDGDMFYGQDRLEMLKRALSQPFADTWPAA